MTVHFTIVASPIDDLLLTSEDGALTRLHMTPHTDGHAVADGWVRDDADPVLAEARRQLDAYFAGEGHDFDLPLAPAGTPFQVLVWHQLTRIPYGRTISYGELARRIANPSASRAVGLANGRNPIAVIVPCHRVIGADGSLTGFGGGLDRKRALLALEQGVLTLPV
ncbi:MAG: methylated-DNA--[protein]-cysteine S-methyltransferase [Acidimicrobiales bacterium]